jgi:hypothetical protein
MSALVKSRSFIGRVNYTYGEESGVTLHDRKTDDYIEAKCATSTLDRAGIHEGDEFMCVVTKRNIVKLRRLKPKPISQETIKEIEEEFKGRWLF